MTMEYGTITGRLVAAVADTTADVDLNPDIVPITGTVTFTPSVKAILVESEDITVVPAPIVAALDAQGYVSLNGVRGVTVLATDSTYYNPNGWTYKVSFDNLAAAGKRVTFNSYSIDVPAGETVDLSFVTPVPSSGGQAIVRGPKGDKGDVGPQGPQGVATKFSSGSNPYDAALVSAARPGDLFMYDQSGANPGWLYTRNTANTDWVYTADLTSTVRGGLATVLMTDRILVGSGIDPTGTTDSTAGIKALLDANPGIIFYVPPGSYRLNSTLVVSKSNGLVLSPNARIFAGAAMDTLIQYAPTLPSGQYAEDKCLVGGVLDGANLANTVLSIATVLHFTLTRVFIKDGVKRGLVTVAGKGAEIMAYDLRFLQTGTANLADNVAIDAQMGDCHFENIIVRDWVTAVRDVNANRFDKVHVWLSGNGIATRYPGSVAFDLTNATNLTGCYADTYQTAFKLQTSTGRPRMRNMRAMWNASVLSGITAGSYVFDNSSAVGVFCYGVDVAGRSDVPTEFLFGTSAKMNVIDPISGGNVNSVQQYRNGFAVGTTSFTPNLFGSTTSGAQTYGSRSGFMDVSGDGYVTYRFTITATLGSDIAGNFRIGGLPMVTGATSVNFGQGPIVTASGATTMHAAVGANGTSGPLVAVPQTIAGAEVSTSGLGGTSITIRGSITCPLT